MAVFDDGRVVLSNPERPEMGVHVVMTASVLAEIFDRYSVGPFTIIAALPPSSRLTRIDLAVDAQRGSLDFDGLEQAIIAKNTVTKARTMVRYTGLDTPGDTIYVGAPASTQRLRVYDKAAEQGVENFEWTRIELQSRKPMADVIRHNFARSGFAPGFIPGVIVAFIDFPTCADWKTVFDCPAIAMKAPPKERNNTYEWLINIAAPALARFQHEHPGETALADFMERYRKEYRKHNI
jgi:hypothetical protein